jgi:8-oxo-dGTP diphosphatase
MTPLPSIPRRVDNVDWAAWSPQQRATLMFVVRDGQVLLIHKKRGLGAGKINGPGGRLEPGESAMAAAIRETREEIGVVPLAPIKGGELFFQFVDGLAIHVEVFRSSDALGTPVETDEAVPLWVPLDAIPYARMWRDDAFWLPLLLAGRAFTGHFIFDGDTMLDHRLLVDDR